MPLEIERKYKLIQSPDNKFYPPGNCIHIKQGYLATGLDEVRVRTVNNVYGFITVKLGSGLIREEFEHRISLATANQLMQKCKNQINKSRYKFERFEIDVFNDHNSGLILVEIELVDPDEQVLFPYIFDGFVLEDVTMDTTYKNQYLASHTVV